MFNLEKELWVLMTKNRKGIVKGESRNREVVQIDDEKDRKKYATYTSKARALSAKKNGCIGYDNGDLIPVRIKMTMEEIGEDK